MNVSMFISGGEYRGDYSGATTYRRNNIVKYSGFAYQATSDSFSGITPDTATHWRRLTINPSYGGVVASTTETASGTTTGTGTGTRKYWFGQEWVLEKPETLHVRLKKVYKNCNCNCNCINECNCQNNQPNCGNCSDCSWLTPNNGCHCACLLQSNCNCADGNCNCVAICNDGNCYY